jgi:hypothetical protein
MFIVTGRTPASLSQRTCSTLDRRSAIGGTFSDMPVVYLRISFSFSCRVETLNTEVACTVVIAPPHRWKLEVKLLCIILNQITN